MRQTGFLGVVAHFCCRAVRQLGILGVGAHFWLRTVRQTGFLGVVAHFCCRAVRQLGILGVAAHFIDPGITKVQDLSRGRTLNRTRYPSVQFGMICVPMKLAHSHAD